MGRLVINNAMTVNGVFEALASSGVVTARREGHRTTYALA